MNQTIINSSIEVLSMFPLSTYVKMPIELCGIVTNVLNVAVFLNSRLKDTSYTYMLAKAVANLVYMFIFFEAEILSNCLSCPWSASFVAALNSIQLVIFLASCLHLYTVLIDVALSLHIHFVLINKSQLGKHTHVGIIIGLFVFSILFFGQKPFMYTINRISGREALFYITFSEFGASTLNKTLLMVQTLVRIFLAVVVVFGINVSNLIVFRRMFKRHIYTPRVYPSQLSKLTS